MAAFNTRSELMVAEAAAVTIVSQKLDVLIHHPVFVECSSMQSRAMDAKAKLAKIQEFFTTQYRQSKSTEWSGRLLRAMYYADKFMDEFYLREARERHEALYSAARPLAVLISMYKLGRDLSVLVKKMEDLCDEKFLKEEAEGKRKKEPASSFSLASVPWQGKKLARLTSFWDQQAPTNFLCREVQKKEIRKRIEITGKYERWSSIWGEQGTGKTFLARWAYNQAKYMGYEWRAWVRVSAGMDPREFLLEILKQAENLESDVKDMNIQEIKTKLHRKLAEVNKYFIVLDGVQSSDMQLLQELYWSTPLYSQSHIITTTQDRSIADYTNRRTGLPINLEKLSNDQSQEMLAWKLHRVSNGQRLSKEEKGIQNMCHGLPLCISLLGGFLSNAREHELKELAKKDPTMTLSYILLLSCHKLPDHLKPCFIYMALFPVSFPIPTRRLVRLWLAEGLLDSHCYDIGRKRTRQPEDVGETFILELADRNVIDVVSWRADGSPKACQMLTSLYDMIRPIAMSTGFLHVHAASKSKDGNEGDSTSQQQQPAAQLRERTAIRWIAEHTNIVTDDRGGNYPDLNLSHVCSFMSFYQRRGMLTKDISMFLGKMTSKTNYSFLRVLDLEGVYKPSLHGVLHKLVLLRYLGLRSTVLDSLPSAVADLHHLETLDIKHTNITLLPSSIWKLRNLRHLHLNWFYIDLKKILKACSNNVNALTQLQTLSGLVTGEVKENLMRDLMSSLTTLKLFLQHSEKDPSSGDAGETVARWISFGLTNLQSLTFGVIQEAKPVKKAEKVAKPATKDKKAAKPAEEAQPATVAERAEGAEPAIEAQPDKQDKPEKQAKPKKKAKPLKSQIGPLPNLSLGERHHNLLELYLLGRLTKPSWTQLLPGSLRVLTLSGSRVKADEMHQLGVLLRSLRTLRLLANSFLCKSMTFVQDGFPSLKILKIWYLPKLCRDLENISAISLSDALVSRLEDQKEETTNLHVEKETETTESTDDDEDDGEERGEIEKDSKRLESTDEDDSDDDNEAMASL
ncbi:putative disease resistance RPP13-like protein 2 isoform X2 [Syzygium oleosum]|uniref:putative disease resistance RPP13-like protein 2 isoform X2 n=1 Tax=Syzygium oleosum TaxID=219896 RepID=UPI0024B9DC87|nr:putative disease resistance RPP13-like protein 2 isoform X2 [Syzygium oleosum]